MKNTIRKQNHIIQTNQPQVYLKIDKKISSFYHFK